MIPGGMFTGVPPSTFLAPNDLPYSPLSQTVWGGVAIGNPVAGRLVKYWTVSYSAGVISVKPVDGPIAFTLTVADVLSVSLAFDNNMGLVISYMLADGAYLYYFNSVTSAYITRGFLGISSCRICVDDARSFYTSDSDVFFVYTLNNRLCYRMQRDRYDVERYIRDTRNNIIRIGPNINNRFQIELSSIVAPMLINPPTVISVEGMIPLPVVVPVPNLLNFESTLYTAVLPVPSPPPSTLVVSPGSMLPHEYQLFTLVNGLNWFRAELTTQVESIDLSLDSYFEGDDPQLSFGTRAALWIGAYRISRPNPTILVQPDSTIGPRMVLQASGRDFTDVYFSVTNPNASFDVGYVVGLNDTVTSPLRTRLKIRYFDINNNEI